eukprot:Skav200506  [mRNA]  locus=scaffold450:377121:377492:+ [translate_table: standard]
MEQQLVPTTKLVKDKAHGLAYILMLPRSVLFGKSLQNVSDVNMLALCQGHLCELFLKQIDHLLPEFIVLFVSLGGVLLEFEIEAVDSPHECIRQEQRLYEAIHVARVVCVLESHMGWLVRHCL